MKPLRQQNRPIVSYVPRVEPTPPRHAWRMEEFRDVWVLKNKYVAFILVGDRFRQSPGFDIPQAAQRWADQIRQDEL